MMCRMGVERLSPSAHPLAARPRTVCAADALPAHASVGAESRSDMKPPKPQMWTREYQGSVLMRIETATAGRWQVTRDGGTDGAVSPTSSLAAMQRRADRLSGGQAVAPWRRVCRCCEAPMTFELRNRPDSGPQFPQSALWVCSSRACDHAEPADD